MPEQSEIIYEAILDLCARLRVSRQDLATAMGRDRSGLSPGRIGKGPGACATVVWCFTKANRPQLASALALDANGYRTLCRWTAELVEVLYGDDPAASGPMPASVAAEHGEVGLHLFAASQWPLAESHLQTAWSHFRQHPPSPSSPHCAIALKTGSQLASLALHVGNVDVADSISRSLLSWRLNPDSVSPHTRRALAGVYIGAAMVERHRGALPEKALDFLSGALQLLDTAGGDPVTLAAVWRDRAKPLCLRAGGFVAGPASALRFEEAMRGLDFADAAVLPKASKRGRKPVLTDVDYETELALNGLTRVACLAAAGRSDDALRAWESLVARAVVTEVPGPAIPNSLWTKTALVRVTTAYCQAGLDGAGVAADSLFALIGAGAGDFGQFRERLTRLQRLRTHAAAGNERLLLANFIR